MKGKFILAFAAIAVAFSACKKDSHYEPIEASGIGFVHASPGAGPLDLIVDNGKINTKDFNYADDLGYFAAYPGTHLLGVTQKDNQKYVATLTASFKPGSFYSVFVTDTLKRTKLFAVEDDLKAPDADKAKVRFINLSPDAAKFDLAVQGKDAVLVAGKGFKEFSDFISIDPSDSYTFQLKDNNSATVKVSLPNVKIEKGKIYTIWAKGFVTTQTDDLKLGLSVMTNK